MFGMMDTSKAIQFLKTDIWRIRERDLSRPKSLLIRHLRILILTFRGFLGDRCQFRASALTFYSLLSVAPVLAMGFGISKGFGFEKALEKLLLERLEGQEQVVSQIVEFSRALLENVRGGFIAGIGLIILFYTIIKILSHIESAFNDIWGIKESRSLGRKISDYLSLMFICPVLFIISSTSTVFIKSGAKFLVERISLLESVSPAIFSLLKFLPYGVFWILFTFLYIFIPNTRVNFISGALAGIIAGTLYEIFQWGYIVFQIGVSRYNAIYGSFAALPLFFIWLQWSWLIVLFGAEIAFAHQNVDTYEFEKDSQTASHRFKRLLSLRVVHLMVNHFSEGGRAWNAAQFSQKLEIPIRLVEQILYDLVQSRIVIEIKSDDERAVAYQPARDPDTMTIKSVIDALEEQGSDNIPVAQSEELRKLSESLKIFSDLIEESPANMRLKEI